jgi:hypothetical protein
MMRWPEYVASMRRTEIRACRVSMRDHEGKKLLGRPRRRWEDNIRMERRK